MHILEIVSGRSISGAVVHCSLLTRGLAARGHRVTLLCRAESPFADPGGPIAAEAAGVCLLRSEMDRWPSFEFRRLQEYADSEGVDVIHSHMSRANNFALGLKWRTRLPWVATAHAHNLHPHWLFVDAIIAVSNATAEFLTRRVGVRAARIRTVYNFLDLERTVRVSEEERIRARASLGGSDNLVLVGAIGNLLPEKGQLHLLRALSLVVKEAPRTRLVLVGSESLRPDYVHRLRQEARRLEIEQNVTWAGERRDIPAVMSALDLHAMAAEREAFGLASLEAMACGTPVIATAVGGVPEVIDYGATGLLVERANPRSLAAAMLCLVNNPDLRRRLGDAGRRSARRRFGLDEGIAATEAVLMAAVSHSHRTDPGQAPLPRISKAQ